MQSNVERVYSKYRSDQCNKDVETNWWDIDYDDEFDDESEGDDESEDRDRVPKAKELNIEPAVVPDPVPYDPNEDDGYAMDNEGCGGLGDQKKGVNKRTSQICNPISLFSSQEYKELSPMAHSVFHYIRSLSTTYGWYNGFEVHEFTRLCYPRSSKSNKTETVNAVLDALEELVDAKLIFVDGTTLYRAGHLQTVGWAKHQGHVEGINDLVTSSFHGPLRVVLLLDVAALRYNIDQHSKNPEGLARPNACQLTVDEAWEESVESLEFLRYRAKSKAERKKARR